MEDDIKKLDDWFDSKCPIVLPNGIMVRNHRFFYSHEKYMEMYMSWRYRWAPTYEDSSLNSTQKRT